MSVGKKAGSWLALVLLLPRGENFLDLFRPLNFPAAFVAVLRGKKNLALAICAEESLLRLQSLGHGSVRNPRERLREIMT